MFAYKYVGPTLKIKLNSIHIIVFKGVINITLYKISLLSKYLNFIYYVQ